MPSYATLAILALVAPTIFPTQSAPVPSSVRLPDMFNSSRFRSRLWLEVSVFQRRFWGEGGGFRLKNINWKQKLKNFGISLGIGAASAEAGAKFYDYATGDDENNSVDAASDEVTPSLDAAATVPPLQ